MLGLLAMLASLRPAAGEGFDAARPETWTLRDPDLYGVAAHGDRVWAVGYWGSVLRSGDGGSTWEVAPTPVRETLFDVSFADARHGWASGENGTILRSVDGGRSWRRQVVRGTDASEAGWMSEAHLFAVSAVSDREAWCVGDLGIVLHTRDGELWEPVAIPEEVFADAEVTDRILNAVDFTDPQHGWIAGEFGTVLRTRDGGETWVGERSFQGASDDAYLFDVSAVSADEAAVSGLAGTVLVTSDGGYTWEARRIATASAVYAVSWDLPGGAAVANRGEIFATEDRGRSWSEPSRPAFFNWLAGIATAGNGRLFAVGEQGLILRSDDAGASWRQLFGREPPPLSGISVPEPGASRELGREERRIRLAPGEPR
jgi:photosystem II stability/assembly factor-like uncharacterized protein